MLTLAAIIIQRIKDIQRIKKIQSKANTLSQQDHELDTLEQKMHKVIAQIQKRQSARITNELTTINDLRSEILTSQDNINNFFDASMGIFRAYSPTFQQRFETKEKESNVGKANRLYRQFLSKHANTFHFAHIYSCLKKQMADANPVLYLGLIGQWSRGLLAETIQKQTNSSEALRLKAQINRITGNKMMQQKEASLVLHTRQNFYGYFLSELEEYYKRLQVLDLDMEYLQSIKPMGSKEQILGKNTRQSLHFIIAKANAQTAYLTQQFYRDYRTHFKSQKQTKAARHSSLKSHGLKKLKTIEARLNQEQQDDKLQQELLLHQDRSQKKRVKVLLKSSKKIQFPLIPSAHKHKIDQSPTKAKKPFKLKTQKQAPHSPPHQSDDFNPTQQSRVSHQIKLQLILAENEYKNRSRHFGLIRQVRPKNFYLNQRQRTQMRKEINCAYNIFEMKGQQNNFLLFKLK